MFEERLEKQTGVNTERLTSRWRSSEPSLVCWKQPNDFSLLWHRLRDLSPLFRLAACSTWLCPDCFRLQFPWFLQVRRWKGQQLLMEDLTSDPFPL